MDISKSRAMLLYMLVAILSAQNAFAALPLCIVQFAEGIERPCYFVAQKSIPGGLLSPYRIIPDQNKTMVFRGSYFASCNVTVPLNNLIKGKFEFIEKRFLKLNQRLENVILWEIQPLEFYSFNILRKPTIKVVVSICPIKWQDKNNEDDDFFIAIQRLKNETNIAKEVKKIVTKKMLSTLEKLKESAQNDINKHPIHNKFATLCSNENKRECDSLLNQTKTKLDFKPTFGGSVTLELRLVNSEVDGPFNVTLLISPCEIDCVKGAPMNCTFGNMRMDYFRWENYRPLVINVSRPGYYCARLAPIHMCCAISPSPLNLTEIRTVVTETFVPVYSTQDFPENYFLGFVWIGLMCLLTSLFISSFFIAKTKYCLNYEGNSDETVDGDLLNNNQDGGKSSASDPNSDNDVEVLLLYQGDSEEFNELMAKFRNLISLFFTKVWDPHCPQHVEEVSANPPEWIDKILASNRVKVIIVDNKWSHLSDSVPVREHYLDKMFKYAITAIRFNPELTQNYTKLFIIQFDLHVCKSLFLNIVPCTRYQMPDHLNFLLSELKTGMRSERITYTEVTTQLISKRILELNSALRRYEMSEYDDYASNYD